MKPTYNKYIEKISCNCKPTDGKHPDPCLGLLPGVAHACCGHGNRYDAYIMFDNGLIIRGFDVVEYSFMTEEDFEKIGNVKTHMINPDGVEHVLSDKLKENNGRKNRSTTTNN